MLLVALADARRRRRCHHGLDLHAILFAHLVNCFRYALIVGFGRVNYLHHVQLLGAHHLAISVIVLLLQASPCPRPLLLLYHLHVPRLQFHSLHTFLIFLFFAGFGRMRIRVSLCDRLLFAIGVHLLHLDVGLEWCLWAGHILILDVFLDSTIHIIVLHVGIADQIREVLNASLRPAALKLKLPIGRLVRVFNNQIVGRVDLVSADWVQITDLLVKRLLLLERIVVVIVRQHLIRLLLCDDVGLVGFRTEARQCGLLNDHHTAAIQPRSILPLFLAPRNFLLNTPWRVLDTHRLKIN